MVWPESETSFWRRQQNEARGRETAPRSRARTATPEARPPIAQAIFLCKAQAKFLDKAREALQRMQELAIHVQENPPAGREACLEEFDTLVAFLEKLADTEIDGVKLFRNANEIVPLEGDNRLIMAGIDLNSETFQSALRVRITTLESVTHAIAALQRGLRFLTINREILSSNVARLFFARDGLDKLKESLQPA